MKKLEIRFSGYISRLFRDITISVHLNQFNMNQYSNHANSEKYTRPNNGYPKSFCFRPIFSHLKMWHKFQDVVIVDHIKPDE